MTMPIGVGTFPEHFVVLLLAPIFVVKLVSCVESFPPGNVDHLVFETGRKDSII